METQLITKKEVIINKFKNENVTIEANKKRVEWYDYGNTM